MADSPFVKIETNGSPFKRIADKERQTIGSPFKRRDDKEKKAVETTQANPPQKDEIQPQPQEAKIQPQPQMHNESQSYTPAPQSQIPQQSNLSASSRDMRQQGVPTQTVTSVNKEESDSQEMLVSNAEQCCMYLVKSKQNIQIKTKEVYAPGFFGMQQVGTEISPKSKNKFESKPVANFVITEAVHIKCDYGYEFHECVKFECKTLAKGTFSVMIPMPQFEKRNIKRSIEAAVDFPVFPTNLEDAKINKLLYNHIKTIWNSDEYRLLYKPGFHQNNKGDWIFIAHEDDFPMASRIIQNSYFEEAEFECKEARGIVRNYCRLIANSEMWFLALLRLASLLRTPLASLGYYLDKAVVIHGCDTIEQKRMLNACLQVYNRHDTASYSVHKLSGMKQMQLQSMANDNKDCVLILDDNTAAVRDKKMTADEKGRLERIAELFSYHQENAESRVECHCVLLSNRAMCENGIADEAFLFYDMSFLETVPYGKLMKRCYAFDQVVVSFMKKHFNEWKNVFEMIDEDDAEDFEYESSRNAYKMLGICIGILKAICGYYQYSEFDDEFYQGLSDDTYNIIIDSEDFNDEDAIVEEFEGVLNFYICNDTIQLVDANILNREISDDEPIIYVKDDLLLMDINLFRKLLGEVLVFAADREGNKLREILLSKNLLVSNTGEKRTLYKTSVDGTSNRSYFVAVRTRLLDDDARERLPTKGEVVYHAIKNDDGIERIKLGVSDNGEPVYWSIGAGLTNKHLFIRGKSGSGKTYLLTVLAKKLHDLGKRVIILDCSKVSGYDEIELKRVLDDSYIAENITISKEAKLENVIQSQGKIAVIRSSVPEAEELLDKLITYCNEHKAEGTETYVIFDEIAEVRISETSALGMALLQGRKINLSMITATQILYGRGVKAKIMILNQSSLNIALPMDKTMRREVAREIDADNVDNYANIMQGLKRGEALVYGEIESQDGEIQSGMCVKAKITND